MENEKQRALPFDLSKGFTAIPKAVMRHYTYLPGFNGNVVLVYGYIITMYNPQYGYVFPTHDQIGLALNMSRKTVGKHLNVLEDAELIKVSKRGGSTNDTYTLLKPIEDERAFYSRFPQAWEKRKKVEATTGKDVVRYERKARYEDSKDSSDDILAYL
ncbi:ArsR family transcriptional regulator [Bacillus cereus]|uniref:ArsR family transcriptional regulator n=1 Tax=Bacillus cereus TaxID=1396 RepID=UPI0025708E03|nr:ArsR family transcriptional regulator [Bacillus cereus]WJE22412.1 ArsR family transcriptional regulator [Bacillus cereus]